jgi:hypothetical protein
MQNYAESLILSPKCPGGAAWGQRGRNPSRDCPYRGRGTPIQIQKRQAEQTVGDKGIGNDVSERP